ncbi:MAG: HAD family hydrolase [Desulfobacterales bacterium]|jgi:FMN phosphatase YigB (HAD superfamily)
MINAVLLDLDNTMLLFDETVYVNRYFEALAPRFSDWFSQGELARRVIGATAALRRNQGAQPNRDFFLAHFCDGSDVQGADVWKRFMDFYENDYDGIQIPVAAPAGLHRTLETLGSSGLKLVLASNPVFPKTAQETRMSWAGIPPHLFDLFTHIDNMAFVKPDAGYYRQICDMLREPPAACLMVGNDPVGDMAAKLAGLKTYRATDAERGGFATVSLTDRRNPLDPVIPDPDHAGPFAGVLSILNGDLGKNRPGKKALRAVGAVSGL